MTPKEKSARRMAREVAKNAVFVPYTNTPEEIARRIAMLKRNIATVEARGPRSAGLANMLREDLAKLEAN